MNEALALFLLILVANGSPVAARALLGDRLAAPLDGDRLLGDGRPLFGRSKTITGLLVALVSTTGLAAFLGPGWRIGLLVGALSMLGDLFSSFVKRRLGLRPGTRAIGLDHLPESLLPVLATMPLLGIGWIEAVGIALGFMITDLLLSRLLYRAGIGDHPH